MDTLLGGLPAARLYTRVMFAYAMTIFVGAFLLFQVQPLIAKYILPWFGGGPGVWTTCMLFFQVLLLGGYAYAHFTSRWLRPRTQAVVHLVLLAAALAFLPITPADAWKPMGAENPVLRILALLAVSVGLPYFVLSATGPLMQQWFTRTSPGRSPYRLYALSNAGSLLALVSYPFFFETHFARKTQAGMWAGGLVAFVIFCGYCALKLWKSETRPDAATLPRSDAPTLPTLTRLLWLLLPACASVLLLATTNKICQDVAVIPFLWVLPLALYLLSFIICFDSPRWYLRFPFGLALLLSLCWICWALPKGTETSLRVLVAGYSFCLFAGCMVCHGEVYRLRPDPKHLTFFYLLIAAGGALGGVLVAVVAPLVFNDYQELPLGYLLCGALLLAVWMRERQAATGQYRIGFAGGGLLVLVFLALLMRQRADKFGDALVEKRRSFYGVLAVVEDAKDNSMFHHFSLWHGSTLHGLQFVDPAAATWPTLYYEQSSGAGRALLSLPHRDRRIGLVGLGVGTLAAYARTNDYCRFYEIDPEVMRMATRYFTYAGHCAGKVDCVIGDARLSLEREPAERFDLLALDAFSGDSIPVHLLTKEAFAVYDRHMNTNGIIAVHTSNNYLDLEPLLVHLAAELKYHVAVVEAHPPPDQWWVRQTIWILLSHSPEALTGRGISEAARPPETNSERVRVWTDDFSSLFQVLR